MKRLMVLSVCLMACSPLVAAADTIIDVTGTSGSDTGYVFAKLDYTRTAVSDTVDQLWFDLSSLEGVTTGYAIKSMEGTWTASNGSILVAQGKATSLTSGTYKWGARTSNMGAELEENTSWVNLDSIIGTLDATTGQYTNMGQVYFDRTGTWDATSTKKQWTGTDSDYLKGSWFTTGDGINMSDTENLSNLFAVMYVSTGAELTYSGILGFTCEGGIAPALTFTTVPEPGTIALLLSGMIGLVAYAWRKRK